jgi:2-dehydropantoate 2-reductase
VTVKLPALASAAKAIAPVLGPDTRVAVAANGLEPDAELARALGRPVQRVIVQLGVTFEEPGVISSWGGSGLQLGPGAAEDELADLFTTSGFQVTRCDDLAFASWRKFAVNCVMNPLSVITGRVNREIVAPDLADLRRGIIDEVRRVAAASGVDLPADLAERLERSMADSGNRTSMLQDFERGRPTEIDQLNGWLVRRADELGIDAPVNRRMVAEVRRAVVEANEDAGA